MRCLSHFYPQTRELYHEIGTGPQGKPEPPQGDHSPQEAVAGAPLFRENPSPCPSPPSHVHIFTGLTGKERRGYLPICAQTVLLTNGGFFFLNRFSNP